MAENRIWSFALHIYSRHKRPSAYRRTHRVCALVQPSDQEVSHQCGSCEVRSRSCCFPIRKHFRRSESDRRIVVGFFLGLYPFSSHRDTGRLLISDKNLECSVKHKLNQYTIKDQVPYWKIRAVSERWTKDVWNIAFTNDKSQCLIMGRKNLFLLINRRRYIEEGKPTGPGREPRLKELAYHILVNGLWFTSGFVSHNNRWCNLPWKRG